MPLYEHKLHVLYSHRTLFTSAIELRSYDLKIE